MSPKPRTYDSQKIWNLGKLWLIQFVLVIWSLFSMFYDSFPDSIANPCSLPHPPAAIYLSAWKRKRRDSPPILPSLHYPPYTPLSTATSQHSFPDLGHPYTPFLIHTACLANTLPWPVLPFACFPDPCNTYPICGLLPLESNPKFKPTSHADRIWWLNHGFPDNRNVFHRKPLHQWVFNGVKMAPKESQFRMRVKVFARYAFSISHNFIYDKLIIGA